MTREERARRLTSLPNWNYEFVIEGERLPLSSPTLAERHNERRDQFFKPLLRLFGGDLKEKRVLDLGCNAGFFGYSAFTHSCEFVKGVDAEQHRIDQANFVFEAVGADPTSYDFKAGDLFELIDPSEKFDIVLCLGLLHRVRFDQFYLLLELIDTLSSDVIVIDTILSNVVSGMAMELHRERDDQPNYLENGQQASTDMYVTRATRLGIETIMYQKGYECVVKKPTMPNNKIFHDYHSGARRTILCSKKSGIAGMGVEADPKDGNDYVNVSGRKLVKDIGRKVARILGLH